MGFNLKAGHPSDILGEGDDLPELMRDRFGDDVSFGEPGNRFCLEDELAWSWWSELQHFALKTLGEDGSKQIRAVDAWQGVYIDADVDRELIRRPRTEQAPSGPSITIIEPHGGGFLSRLKRFFGFGGAGDNSPASDPAIRALLKSMVDQYGSRDGEQGAVQVGNLRRLMTELESLLAALNIEPTQEAVDSLRRSYHHAERIDDDGHIQCLCHAWLTARHALHTRAPLWLIK